MTGNKEQLIYDDIRNNPNFPTILKCLEDDPPRHAAYLKIWINLLNVYLYMGIQNQVEREHEWGARDLLFYGIFLPCVRSLNDRIF